MLSEPARTTDEDGVQHGGGIPVSVRPPAAPRGILVPAVPTVVHRVGSRDVPAAIPGLSVHDKA